MFHLSFKRDEEIKNQPIVENDRQRGDYLKEMMKRGRYGGIKKSGN
jgi:hypothetical protein